MTVCIFSDLHLRLLNDLLKNVVGAFFLLCFAYYLHSLMTENTGKNSLLLTVTFMLLTAASHLLDFGFALLLMIVYSSVALLIGLDRRRTAKNVGFLLLTVLVLAVVAIAIFPSSLGNWSKGVSFFQGLFASADNGMSPQFFLDPMSVAFITAILGLGFALSFYEYRSRRKQAFLAVVSVTITGTLLSLPFIPIEWLWRFVLMDFIPISFILGYSVSRIKMIQMNMRRTALSILFLLCLSLIVLHAFQSSRMMGPSVQQTEYNELQSAGAIIPSESVLIGDLRYGYWLQYISRCAVSTAPSADYWQQYEHLVFLIDKFSPRQHPPPPNSTIIFDGDHFSLYEQSRP